MENDASDWKKQEKEKWEIRAKQIQVCKKEILFMLRDQEKNFMEILATLYNSKKYKASIIYLAFGQLEDDGVIAKNDEHPPVYHVVK